MAMVVIIYILHDKLLLLRCKIMHSYWMFDKCNYAVPFC